MEIAVIRRVSLGLKMQLYGPGCLIITNMTKKMYTTIIYYDIVSVIRITKLKKILCTSDKCPIIVEFIVPLTSACNYDGQDTSYATIPMTILCNEQLLLQASQRNAPMTAGAHNKIIISWAFPIPPTLFVYNEADY